MAFFEFTDDLDLDKIACSGQCFRWEKTENEGYRIPAYGRTLTIAQVKGGVEADCTAEEWQEIWRVYFDLDTDYAAIRSSVDPKDAYLTAAAASGKGIRVLRQELWETSASFIISQNNNIPRIRGCIRRLCEQFSSFPSPQKLLTMGMPFLNSLGLGYRAAYLYHAAEFFSSFSDAAQYFEHLSTPEARETLLSVPGIGPKVADCILLFGLYRREAFPVDTWIRKVLLAHYEGQFPTEKYPGCAGIMQQYIFYYERLLAQYGNQPKSFPQ